MSLVFTVAVAGSAVAARPDSRPEAAVGNAGDVDDDLRAVGLSAADRAIGEGGDATLVGGRPGRPLTPPSGRNHSSIARSFVDRVAPAFGLDNGSSRLDAGEMSAAGNGGQSRRFEQVVDGVPVLGGGLNVRVGADGSVMSVAGELSDTEIGAVTNSVSADRAAVLAVEATARAERVDRNALSASTPELLIYDPALIGVSDPLGTRVVWRVDVIDDGFAVDRFVLVDAESEAIALSFTQRTDARNRRVCTRSGARSSTFTCTSPVRSEGGPAAGAGSDVDIAYDLSGVAYDFYAQLFGRDSIDGAGMPLVSTTDYCPTTGTCPFRNAFWTGSQMVYGSGFATADDVVVHELTHGVIQHTAQLLYYSESGAINESIADVMGELADQRSSVGGIDSPTDRWLLGEQLPIGAIRDMANPGRFRDPDKMTSPQYWGSESDNYGVHINSGVNNRAAVLMVDGGTFNGVVVRPIGAVTTARIYYEALTSLLGPGSDYLDLYHALQQACTNLTADGLATTSDCQQVTAAVTATEMNLPPVTAGARLRVARCDTPATTETVFADDMESNTANWISQSTSSAAAWRFITGSSQSGTRSAFAPDRSSVSDASLVSALPVTIPSAPAYLRFDHSFGFEFGGTESYDGGLVEYSVGGPAGPWQDAGALPGTVNGYNANIVTGFGNPLGGRASFGRNSPGYQQSRINLGSLSGRDVWFRFRVGSDEAVGDSGWFVDDVEIYACRSAGASATTTTIPGAQPGPTTTTTSTTTPTPTTTTVPSAPSPAAVSTPGFNGVGPRRLVDSRGAVGAGVSGVVAGQRLGAGRVLVLDVSASGVVPGSGVGAVSLNVTVTDPVAAGFVTVFPCGVLPGSSSVNFGASQTVANAVVSPVSAAGEVCVFSLVDAHVIVDINAWFAD
ncbi:MAG: M4 family metallopeptidase [Ilumatobacteraceae bacterium]